MACALWSIANFVTQVPLTLLRFKFFFSPAFTLLCHYPALRLPCCAQIFFLDLILPCCAVIFFFAHLSYSAVPLSCFLLTLLCSYFSSHLPCCAFNFFRTSCCGIFPLFACTLAVLTSRPPITFLPFFLKPLCSRSPSPVLPPVS